MVGQESIPTLIVFGPDGSEVAQGPLHQAEDLRFTTAGPAFVEVPVNSVGGRRVELAIHVGRE